MYNWIDGRKFSNSKSLLAFSLTSKHINPFIKNGFEMNSFSQLPVIKEEEGYLSENEVELSQEVLPSSLLKNNHSEESTSYETNSNEYTKCFEKIKDSKIIMKLPPLVNINCLMNPEIKQTQAIWNTNFGKRLIHGKSMDKNLNSTDVKIPSSNDKMILSSTKKDNNKFGDCQVSKYTSKRKCIQEQSIKNGGGDKIDFKQIKTNKKKPKKIKKNNQNLLKKKPSQEKNCIEKKAEYQLTENFQENLSKESLKQCQTISSFSKKQRFLTECVKSILDCYSTQITCEYCNEKLPNIEEFNAHKKQHEDEKETCLLCNKVFYKSNKFIQHLLTHEGVDQFSCKKCKKYFPNLRKYKQHCKNYHSTLVDNINYKSQHNIELMKKWLPKFEYKQTKADNSEKTQEYHRRDHVKKDIINSHSLSYKNE